MKGVVRRINIGLSFILAGIFFLVGLNSSVDQSAGGKVFTGISFAYICWAWYWGIQLMASRYEITSEFESEGQRYHIFGASFVGLISLIFLSFVVGILGGGIYEFIKYINRGYEEAKKNRIDAEEKLKDARALEPLIQALKDENWYVRSNAAEALGNIGWQPKNDVERAYYLIAVGKWDDLVELEEQALIQVLNDKDRYIREVVKKALEKIRKKETKN